MIRLRIWMLALLRYIPLSKGELQSSIISGSYVFQTFTEDGYYPNQTAFCEGRGGWPSEPRTEQLNSDLASILNSSSSNGGYFIGLVYQGENWKWQTDRTIPELNKWNSGTAPTPSTGNNDNDDKCKIYAIIMDAGAWESRWGTSVSAGCGAAKRRFACQYNPCGDNPCENGGSCSPRSATNPKDYDCTCVIGSYGDNCTNDYCMSSPCENGGSCTPTVGKEPYYNCTCANGYYGYNCTKFLQVSTDQTVVAVEGYPINISVTINSTGSLSNVTITNGTNDLGEKNNVETGIIIFTLTNVQESDEGNYTITSSSLSESYQQITKTYMKVHVESRVQSLVPKFIFSPITSGPDKVTCKVYGKPTPEYGWFKDKNAVSNDTASLGVYQTFDTTTNEVFLYVENAQLTDNGTYVCRTTNKVGKDNREVTAVGRAAVAVYGSPIIESAAAVPCTDDGTITINWKPNDQTESVNHKAVISTSNSDQVISEKDISYSNNKTFNVVSLEPNADYTILIKVCPDQCIDQLNTSVKNKTGDGTPAPVTNLNVAKGNDSCAVNWNAPTDSRGEITLYKIEWTSVPRYNPSESTLDPDVTSDTTAPAIRQNVIITVPNREYKATVYAETCAGSGAKEMAGSCITAYEPPATIDPAVVQDTNEKKATRNITISPVDETNGPVSCIFVVVRKGNGWEDKTFTPDDLETLENNAVNGDSSKYIALAIESGNITSKGKEAQLGDGSTSSCDASTRNRKKRQTNTLTFRAVNFELEYNGDVYSFVIVTVTLNGAELLLQQSEIQTFVQGEPITWITAVAVVVSLVVLIAAILAIVFVIRKRKRTKKDPPSATQEIETTIFVDTPQFYENLSNGDTLDHNIQLPSLDSVYREKKANESMIFREEYNDLKRTAKLLTVFPCTFGKGEAMIKRNRFKNIIPYDSTRVALKGEGVDSYINACHIKGPGKRFIASQGPLPHTIKDFWRMVVEQRCRCIVMLTKCEEAGRKKCEKYWPDVNQAIQYGAYNVRNSQEKHCGGYVKRRLKIFTRTNDEISVDQYQFLRWPDHGVPKTTSTFFRLHREVMKNHEMMKTDAPIIVHCSAGVGRTGTFIGFDLLLEEGKKKGSVNIFDCVLDMRKQRVDMVQTCEQYELLHMLILENYLYGETEVSEQNVSKQFRDTKKLRKEFQNLSKAELLNQITTTGDSSDLQGGSVIILRQPEDKDWVKYDACYVEAYHRSVKLIAASGPSKATVEYFWRAVLDNDIDTVVMLNSVTQDGKSEKYWPRSTEEMMELNSLTIRMVTENEIRGTVHRTLVVTRQNTRQEKEIMHYQCLGWEEHTAPQDACGLLDIVNDLQNKEETTSTILVHSSKGLGRAGAFCVVFNLTERLKNEGKLDIFRAVKDLIDFRPGMVGNMEQYKFCYEAAIANISSRNVYTNEAMEEEIQSPLYENL